MNLSAIQHYADGNFCYALNKDDLEINILTGKDVKKVFIIYGDPFLGDFSEDGYCWSKNEIELTSVKELENHLRWTCTVTPPYKRLKYYFRITDGKENFYFFETEIISEASLKEAKILNKCFIFPWMNYSDINITPVWPENTVWYQIFPTRFARGKNSASCNVKRWGKYGESVRNSEKYGGNLQGIIEKLDYLKELGITGIYMTPVNTSPSEHKYDTQDYLSIDPSLGTNELLKKLVQEAHYRGIKIMLDGVFNHCGWDFFAWQDVLKNKEKSLYKDWFIINDFNFTAPEWGEKSMSWQKKYFSFAFVDKMPKLNTNNPELREYIFNICEKWVKEYDIDALRLDVANEISHKFCRMLKQKMKNIKDDFYIVGEIWHNASAWLKGDEFDSVMNYPLQNAILDFCCNKNKSVKSFELSVNRSYSMYFRQTNKVLFNLIDSHDTVRLISRCKKNKLIAMNALSLLFLMPGSICIYYGTEIFLEGEGDPDNRRCMPWQELENAFFDEDIAFVKSLINLRKKYPSFLSTVMNFIYEENDSQGEQRILNLEKISEDGAEKSGFIMNGAMESYFLKENINRTKILLSYGIEDKKILPGGFIIFLK